MTADPVPRRSGGYVLDKCNGSLKQGHPWNTDLELENSELDLSVFDSARGEEQIRSEKSRSAPPSERWGRATSSLVRNGNRMRAKQEKGTSIATAASVASPATANTKKKSRRQPIPSLVDPEDMYSTKSTAASNRRTKRRIAPWAKKSNLMEATTHPTRATILLH